MREREREREIKRGGREGGGGKNVTKRLCTYVTEDPLI